MSAVKKIESSLSRSLIRKNKESGSKLSVRFNNLSKLENYPSGPSFGLFIERANAKSSPIHADFFRSRLCEFHHWVRCRGSENKIGFVWRSSAILQTVNKTNVQHLFEYLKFSRDAIILTNTSSIRLSDLLPVIANPENFAGLHFFNPVPAMKLVEIAVTSQTSKKVVEILENLCLDIGKKSVRCRVGKSKILCFNFGN